MATKKAKKKTAAKKSKTGSGRTQLIVDLSDTESRGGKKGVGSKRYKEGDYGVKVVKAVTGKSKVQKTPQVEVTFQFLDGKYKGDKIVDQFYLSENSLWRLRNLIEGMGLKVPSKKIKIDIKKWIGKKLAITIEDDEWENDEGKTRVKSRVTDTFLLSELEAIEEEDVELEDDDDEDDEDEDDEDEEEEDEDEDDEDEEDEDEDDDDEIEDLDLDEL